MTVYVTVINIETGSFSIVKAFREETEAEQYLTGYLNDNYGYRAATYPEAREYLYDKHYEDASSYETEVS
jgi:hypothetical protein